MVEKGNISIHTENIFPIIKKFLYADQEAFLRELVSNAVDATQKLKQLAGMGKYGGNVEDLKIEVSIDKAKKTILIRDQGLGMTGEEIKTYINQIAFSGATDFLEKYKDQSQELIGFFGLGFYAAFMVADKVDIITRSYQENAQPVHWTCDGSTHFEITPTEKDDIGTDIILHLSPDAEEFLEDFRIQQLLEKYCKFLPVPIQFQDKVVNNTEPIWTKSPNALKDEDYVQAYKQLYPYAPPPLFWIHLNVDYPFKLTGVLYFPALKEGFELHRDQIQLYSKQVFITDEVKEVVPEFLRLLHGVIDSPDIPLNVSRSALQADSNVKKINAYITKKVADKLGELYKKDPKLLEEKWDSLGLFVKYGMVTEEKFYEKATEFALLKNIDGEYYTIADYQKKLGTTQTDKEGKQVWLYAQNEKEQDMYIQACKAKGYDVLLFPTVVAEAFVDTLEKKIENLKLKRVDTGTVDQLIDQGETFSSTLGEEQQKALLACFEKSSTDSKINWQVAPLGPKAMPVSIVVPEVMLRMKAPGASFEMPMQATINVSHPLMEKILQTSDQEVQQKQCLHALHLGLLSQHKLKGTAMTSFIQQSLQNLLDK